MPPRRRAPPAGLRTDLPPLKIIRKIIVLQLAYYATAAILIAFTTVVYGTAFSLDLILSWDALRGDTTVGWILGLVWLLNSLLCVLFIFLLVSRSKLVPDFALTIHFLHLVTTTFYSRSLPANWLWWSLQFASSILMTSLGIWACRWRELKPISIGVGSSRQQHQSNRPETRNEDQSRWGFLKFWTRSRTQNKFDGGEYEMERMKRTAEQAV